MARLLSLITAVSLTATGAVAAFAADPEAGSVSKAQPKVDWKGALASGYANRIPVVATGDDSVPCASGVTCDLFTLDVKDSDDLTITADAPEGTSTGGDSSAAAITLRIRKPDGSVAVETGEGTPAKPFTVKIKKAATGTYEIEYFNNFIDASEYFASATLGTPAAPAPPAPPAPAPQPAPKEALSVSAKVGKASAKKLNKKRKLSATVTVSREVQSVTATLKKGSSTVGKGSLGAFSGSKKVTLKLSKKLKAGKYSLVLVASDGAGGSAASPVAVKVKR